MPVTKRFFYINCRGEECNKLSEIIMENIPSIEQLDVAVTNQGLYITIYGYKSEIKSIWRKIRDIVNSYKSSIVLSRGYSKVSVEYLFNKFKQTLPPKLLVFILNKLGYRAEYSLDKNTILTNAPLETIEEVANRVIELMNNLKHKVSGSITKYYVIASCILTNQTIDNVLTIGLEINHLYIDENGKYRLRIDWKKALEEVINKFKS